MPQLVGKPCVICRQPIISILDGDFCRECGNPVHNACKASPEAIVKPDHCATCGGDPADFEAQQALHEREARRRQAEGRKQARTNVAGPGVPIAKECPRCGSRCYRKVRPSRTVAFAKDRVCSDCQTRYSPPTPVWGAVVFLLAGLVLAGVGGIGILFRVASGNPMMLPGLLCEGLIAAAGVLALIHGIRSLVRPGEV